MFLEFVKAGIFPLVKRALTAKRKTKSLGFAKNACYALLNS